MLFSFNEREKWFLFKIVLVDRSDRGKEWRKGKRSANGAASAERSTLKRNSLLFFVKYWLVCRLGCLCVINAKHSTLLASITALGSIWNRRFAMVHFSTPLGLFVLPSQYVAAKWMVSGSRRRKRKSSSENITNSADHWTISISSCLCFVCVA